MRKSLKRCCKRCAVRVLRRLPKLPTWFWDSFVHWRLGNKALDVPQVLYVQDSSLDAPAVSLPLKGLPPQQEGFVRLVIISDTHERHRLVQLPAADVFLHCGDILMSSSLARQDRGIRVLRDFNSWLGSLPCAEKVVIGGNHDKALEELGGVANEVISDAILLQDSSAMLPRAGLKVYGNAWSRGESHNRSWQTREPLISDAVHGADVVMSHACNETIEDAVLQKAQPRLWASGHYHREHGVNKRGGTLFVNAAILDRKHNPHQAPVVVDLPKAIAPIAELREEI